MRPVKGPDGEWTWAGQSPAPPRELREEPDLLLPTGPPPWWKAVLRMLGNADLRRIHAACRLDTHRIFTFQQGETMEAGMVRLSRLQGSWRIAASWPKERVLILERLDAQAARVISSLVKGSRYGKHAETNGKEGEPETPTGESIGVEPGHDDSEEGRRADYGGGGQSPGGGDRGGGDEEPGHGGTDPSVHSPEVSEPLEVRGADSDTDESYSYGVDKYSLP